MTALLHQLGGGRQIPVDRAVVLVGRSMNVTSSSTPAPKSLASTALSYRSIRITTSAISAA